jgi:hypothetical protein
MSIVETQNRIDLIKQALWLELLTIAWMVVEAGLAIWSGSDGSILYWRVVD